jgi:hypothetical protein
LYVLFGHERPIVDALKIQQLALGYSCFIAACGDDNLVIINRSLVTHLLGTGDNNGIGNVWNSRGTVLGYVLNPVVTHSIFKAEFCSKVFYPTQGTYVLGGKIGRTLSRAGWFFDNDADPIHCSAIGSLRDNSHVPFLREFFERVIELTPPDKRGVSKDHHKVHCEVAHPYDESTMEFVFDRYGLTKQDLECFKALLKSVTRLPVVVDWPHIARCVEIDNA